MVNVVQYIMSGGGLSRTRRFGGTGMAYTVVTKRSACVDYAVPFVRVSLQDMLILTLMHSVRVGLPMPRTGHTIRGGDPSKSAKDADNRRHLQQSTVRPGDVAHEGPPILGRGTIARSCTTQSRRRSTES